MTSVLIVGAGLSGCTLARQLAEADYTVNIIEKRNHIAGNCYDFIDKNGILVNKYGAHIFHTNSERVWNFINIFS
jgi:UDP-galactopyranose mutase